LKTLAKLKWGARKMSPRSLIATLLFVLTLPFAVANAQSTRLEDDSDWWSILRKDDSREVKPKKELLSDSNFQIAGVSLSERQFQRLAAKLGKATEVERGDAAIGRHQICYESAKDGEKIHLIFEFGEVEETFYLFSGGEEWKGSELCARSRLVTANLDTPSGLRLGLTKAQVEAILGAPDFMAGERMVYFREVRKKTTPKEFEQMRKDYPRVLSDKEAHEWFDFFDVDMYIVTTFKNSKLNYLAVSRSETD